MGGWIWNLMFHQARATGIKIGSLFVASMVLVMLYHAFTRNRMGI